MLKIWRKDRNTKQNFLALKVSLPFRLSTFYPILTWEIHTTEHCRSICKLSLWTLFLTSKCRNSFHTWWTWVLHWGCAGLGNGSGSGLSPLLKQPGWKLHYLEKFGNLPAPGMRLLCKSMERNCPGYKSALSLQCCRGHFPMSRRGLFPGSERQQEELRLHSFGGEGPPLLQYSWPRTRLCPQPWAHGAAAAAAGQCQPSASPNIFAVLSLIQPQEKSPVFRNVLEIPAWAECCMCSSKWLKWCSFLYFHISCSFCFMVFSYANSFSFFLFYPVS